MASKKTSQTTTTTTTHTRSEAFALGREAALKWIVESGGAGFYADVTIRSHGLPDDAAELMQRDQIDPCSYELRTAYENAFRSALDEAAQSLTETVSEMWDLLDEEIGDAVDEVVQQIRTEDVAEDADEEEVAELPPARAARRRHRIATGARAQPTKRRRPRRPDPGRQNSNGKWILHRHHRPRKRPSRSGPTRSEQ